MAQKCSVLPHAFVPDGALSPAPTYPRESRDTRDGPTWAASTAEGRSCPFSKLWLTSATVVVPLDISRSSASAESTSGRQLFLERRI